MALSFESNLELLLDFPTYRKWLSKTTIQPMAIDLAKKLKHIIVAMDLSSAQSLAVDRSWVFDHMSGAPGTVVEEVVNCLNESIQDQAYSCENCSTRCLEHKNVPCPMFDHPFYSGEAENDLDEEDVWVGEDYSDDILEQNIQQASALWEEFSKTAIFNALTDYEKSESRYIVESFTNYMYSYNICSVSEWNIHDMEEICMYTIPRKVTMEDAYFQAIGPVLTAFFQFLDAKAGILKDARSMAQRMQVIGPEIARRARDPRNWGPAKSFVVESRQAGFDLDDPDDIQRAMFAYNARIITNQVGHRQPNPSYLQSRSKPRKIGRNEKCPCGSGLKYKRCCGSNKR